MGSSDIVKAKFPISIKDGNKSILANNFGVYIFDGHLKIKVIILHIFTEPVK